MVRRRDIDAVPAEALADDPPLLIHEIIVREFIIHLPLQVPDRGLALVLLIQLGSQKQARKSYQLYVAPQVPIAQPLQML